MAVYFLTYDLVNETGSQDYEPLWDELKRLKGHRTQYSVWLVNLNNTPIEVREHFQKFLDSDDSIWVTELFKNHYTFANARSGTNDWLSKNPPNTR